MKYSIVDIETTGGHPDYHRITEVAVVVTDGSKVIRRFESLVNPDCEIPDYISSLTGITDEMVKGAPYFEEIAEELLSLTEDCVFVAHNVNFDYSFLRREFQWAGYDFTRKKLCTVRLSRKIFPGFQSYSLGKLCKELDITIRNRHRAGGDTEATFKLFKKLLAEDKNDVVTSFLNKKSGETILPPHLNKESYQNLPSATGVYYFHDNKGKVLYIGKAANIKQRIKSHFSGKFSTNGSFEFFNKVHDISFELCGNELIALLYEASEIKRLWPEFNNDLKYPDRNFGVFDYTDVNGYIRFSVGKMQRGFKPVHTFRYIGEARDFLDDLVKRFDLCAKLCGLQKTKKECHDFLNNTCKGACAGKEAPDDYNNKVTAALENLNSSGKTFAIMGGGRTKEEKSVVVVENGAYMGFAFLDSSLRIEQFSELKTYVKKQKDDRDIQKIIYSYLKKAGINDITPNQIIRL
ncbi:MAG: exonuclease domain-containing protein [Cytophagaceae bacterium]